MAIVLLLMAAIQAADERVLAAKIDGQPVYAAEVEAELRQAYGDRQPGDQERQKLFKAALDQTIDRHLVLRYLTKTGQAASNDDVSVALGRFERELAAQNSTLAEHCEKVGLTAQEVRQALAWKLSWKRYCEKHLTPQNLEKYFERNRREFDGTQLRVAQILLAAESDEAGRAALEQATRLRAEIVAGKIAFADAARRHSIAPSREQGGDIGWIQRHKPMPEDFSAAAFALRKGELGQPFTTAFGLHLITILDEQLGTKTWQDVQDELRPAVVLYLFRWIADRERDAAKIEYLLAE